MYIGLISDTHGTFDKPFIDFLQPVDEIWHAGDFGSLETAQRIAAFKPLKGECSGMKVLMTHIGGYPGRYDPRARAMIDEHHPDIFVCGHSHILRVMPDRKRNMMVINPGAAGKYGFHTVRTALRFHIDNGDIHDMEVFELDKK